MSEWIRELEQPSEHFFQAFRERIAAADGPEGCIREAVLHLVPRVDWQGYLPQIPHGLLGVAAVMALRSHLEAPAFFRLLATQLHAFALEGRAPESRSLHGVGQGSGHWPNIELALREHHPAIVWGELRALESPRSEDFFRLSPFVAPDMANVGHKAVAVHAMEQLWRDLGASAEIGRMLLAWAGWLAATEPEDRFWHGRMARRLEGASVRVERGPAIQLETWHEDLAREVCDQGLVGMLNALAVHLKRGVRSGDLLAGLVLAASEKILDARRDLEGKTAWLLVYLATLGHSHDTLNQPEAWGQAAALVNFFPSDDPEERYQSGDPEPDSGEGSESLLDAILDGEPQRAWELAERMDGSPDDLFRILAQAASRNDPGNNHSSQVLAVAAALRLAPLLPPTVARVMGRALAKSLANSQGSDDLGRKADRALKGTVAAYRRGGS